MSYEWPPLIVVVGSGGVGKTTLAAALGLTTAAQGGDCLVMTFDPSLRLKDTLGVGDAAKDQELEVQAELAGRLFASLLDAKQTFDRLVTQYSPDPRARKRILENRYYNHLAGNLSGVLEYMAVERLFEVANSGRYQTVILDTPPTRQAIDFLEAPSRIIGFLDSGALKLALRSWFDSAGRLKPTARLGRLGRRFERYLDDVVGIDLLRDMIEFFQAFGPLYDGFRIRAREVEELLRSDRTRFLLVAGPGEEQIPDTLFFARRLQDAGYNLGPIVVNRIHPTPVDGIQVGQPRIDPVDGWELFDWLGDRDSRGLERLRSLANQAQPVVGLPLLADEPSNLKALVDLAGTFSERLEMASDLVATAG